MQLFHGAFGLTRQALSCKPISVGKAAACNESGLTTLKNL
jgi:hypothetical protein